MVRPAPSFHCMQITPLSPDTMDDAFATLDRRLAAAPMARAALARIAGTRGSMARGLDRPDHRAVARQLACDFGIDVRDEPPAVAFSWDGRCLRVESEASVVLHEIAHWQICPPERRRLPDFGLGAGPETGRKAEADAARVVSDAAKQAEECLASLLGVLWEAALGQPAIAAFLEQNWFEGWRRPSAAMTFAETITFLHVRGLIADDAMPIRPKIPAMANR
jgi:hypothetical protein